MGNSTLETVSQLIRDLWVIEQHHFELRTTGYATEWGNHRMPRWDGGADQGGKIWKPIWPKIAQFCLENDLDPETLIKALFYKKYGLPPRPNQAYNNQAREQYRLYISPTTQLELKNDVLYAFESQKQKAAAAVFSRKTYSKFNDTEAWRTAIAAYDTQLSPLFRYCVAQNQNWQDLADLYRSKALNQYKRSAAVYDQVWGDWIPADFKTIAQKKEVTYETGTTPT